MLNLHSGPFSQNKPVVVRDWVTLNQQQFPATAGGMRRAFELAYSHSLDGHEYEVRQGARVIDYWCPEPGSAS